VTSFSQDVRTHLAQIELPKPCCQQATLLALLSVCAGEASDRTLTFSVENAAVARLFFRLAKQVFGQSPQLRPPDGHQRTVYRLILELPEEGIGEAMRLSDLQKAIKRRACCRRSFLRGAFMGCGSMVDPERAYHLEFTGPSDVSSWIVSLLASEGIRSGHYQRTGHQHWTAYVKSGEDIAQFLTAVGAVPALLVFQELLISRDLKNHVQRAVNCETANLDRTVSTAQAQIALIEALVERGSITDLSPELQETARLRLEHPYASLAQLAELHDPPMSKSAVNHRLRKLAELATTGLTAGITD